jgi:hypothetical protein
MLLLLIKNCSAGRGGDWAERAVVKRRRRRPRSEEGDEEEGRGAMSPIYVLRYCTTYVLSPLMADLADAIQKRNKKLGSLHRRGPQRHSTVVPYVRMDYLLYLRRARLYRISLDTTVGNAERR